MIGGVHWNIRMTSTLQLVERLKAQLAESRADLRSKDHALEEFATSATSEASCEASATEASKEGALRDCRETESVSSPRSKSEQCLQAQVTALQEELQQKSQSLASKMVGLVTSTKGLSQQLILERQQRLAFEQEVRVLMEAKSAPAQVAGPKDALWDLQQLKQEVQILASRTDKTEVQLQASVNAILAQLSSVQLSQQVAPTAHGMVHGAHALPLPSPRRFHGEGSLPTLPPAFQENRLIHYEAPMELRQVKEEVVDLQRALEVMKGNLEAAIEAVSCQLSAVTAWVQQNFSGGAWSHPALASSMSPIMGPDASATVAARFPQLSPILEDRCIGGDASGTKVQDGSDELSEDLLPFLRLLVDDVPQMVKRMTENSQTLLEKINLERAERVASEAQISEALKRLDERVESFTSRPVPGPTLLHSSAVRFEEKGRMVPCVPRPVAVQRCTSTPRNFVPPTGPVISSGSLSASRAGLATSGVMERPERLTPRNPSVKDGEAQQITEPLGRSCH